MEAYSKQAGTSRPRPVCTGHLPTALAAMEVSSGWTQCQLEGWALTWDFQNLEGHMGAPLWLLSKIAPALPGLSPCTATTSSVTLGNRIKPSQPISSSG